MTSFADRVATAAEAIREIFPITPLQKNDYLSRKYGARIYLKREDLTPVRSYKIRGALNFYRKTLAATMPAFLSALRPVITRRALLSCAGISAARA